MVFLRKQLAAESHKLNRDRMRDSKVLKETDYRSAWFYTTLWEGYSIYFKFTRVPLMDVFNVL